MFKGLIAGCLGTLGGIGLTMSSALATVSEYTPYYIPYERYQSGFICMHQQMMLAEFGIPLASLINGIVAPTRTLVQKSSGAPDYQNINLLAPEEARIEWSLNFDRYHSDTGVTDYSFRLDLAAFDALYGNTVAERQKTRDLAKLMLIALVQTAEVLHGEGQFRIWVQWQNLPAQSDLAGLVVNEGGADWPTWPWTSTSPAYEAYQAEMLHDDCPA